MTGTFHLGFLELEAVLPTLPAQELSLLTCPNLRLQQPLFSLPTLPSLGTVQAAGPEALGTFLTFAFVSSGSWQFLAGTLSPWPGSLKRPIVPTASWPRALALLALSSPSGLLRGRCQPRNECEGLQPALGLSWASAMASDALLPQAGKSLLPPLELLIGTGRPGLSSLPCPWTQGDLEQGPSSSPESVEKTPTPSPSVGRGYKEGRESLRQGKDC